MATASQSSVDSTSNILTDNQGETVTSTLNGRHNSTNSILSDTCVLCQTRKRQLACLPCGHWATCVPCSPPLQSCPVCKKEIESFVSIYT